MKPDIDAVWGRIEARAGEAFTQVRGARFTCRVAGGHVVPDRTVQQISKSHFARALALVRSQGRERCRTFAGPRTSLRF